MHLASLMALQDELEKIAISLNAGQLKGIAQKAGARGWTPVRESQHIRRLLNFETRHAPKSNVFKGPVEHLVGGVGNTNETVARAPKAMAKAQAQTLGAGGSKSKYPSITPTQPSPVKLGTGSPTIHRQRHDQYGYAFPAV